MSRNLKKLFTNNLFWIGIFVFVFGVFINYFSGIYLKNNFEDLPVLPDLFLDNIPAYNVILFYDVLTLFAITACTTTTTLPPEKHTQMLKEIIMKGHVEACPSFLIPNLK